ncbi:MAG TPA: hypothetical protein VF590_04375 [Isosphaeraceae bacterium]
MRRRWGGRFLRRAEDATIAHGWLIRAKGRSGNEGRSGSPMVRVLVRFGKGQPLDSTTARADDTKEGRIV